MKAKDTGGVGGLLCSGESAMLSTLGWQSFKASILRQWPWDPRKQLEHSWHMSITRTWLIGRCSDNILVTGMEFEKV